MTVTRSRSALGPHLQRGFRARLASGITYRAIIVSVRKMFFEIHDTVHQEWHSLFQNLTVNIR